MKTEFLAGPVLIQEVRNWICHLLSSLVAPALVIGGDTGVVLPSGRKQLKPLLHPRMGRLLWRAGRFLLRQRLMTVCGGSGKKAETGMDATVLAGALESTSW